MIAQYGHMNQIIKSVSARTLNLGPLSPSHTLYYLHYGEIAKCAEWSFYGVVNNGRR